MKIKIKREQFANGLQQVLNLAPMKPAMPILANVLIKTEDGKILLKTTNLDIGICCHIQSKIEQSGSIALPVRKLLSIVKSLPNLDVNIDASSGKDAMITSGNSKFRIMGMTEEEFPLLPNFKDKCSYEFPQEEFRRMLIMVSYAQSQNEVRQILNGVHLKFENEKLTLVATDGRRLALTSRNIKIDNETSGSLIIPARTVFELERLLVLGDTVRVMLSDNLVAFKINVSGKSLEEGLVDSLYLISKVVEGNYPNYLQVIPKESDNRIKLERRLLAECVKRAAFVVNKKNNLVKFSISNNLLEISGASKELGESHESIAINYEGVAVNVAFNPDFILHLLQSLSQEEVFFEFKDAMSPGVFKTVESFLCVIMPLRLR